MEGLRAMGSAESPNESHDFIPILGWHASTNLLCLIYTQLSQDVGNRDFPGLASKFAPL